ncbi:MAG: hypothetical protein AAF387_17375 [Pseudomonadota bacterium]
MRYATITLVGLSIFLSHPFALGAEEVTGDVRVTDLEMTTRLERISRTSFRYLFSVSFINDTLFGSTLNEVRAEPSSTQSGITVDVDEITIGDLAEGMPVTKEFTMVINRRTPFDPSAIEWRFFAQTEPPPQPDIVVTPTAVDFGSQPATCEVSQPISVSNEGTSRDLIITRNSPTPESRSNFTVDLSIGGPYPWRLGPGQTRNGVVRYTPRELATHAGTHIIESNDPDTPTLEVPLSGSSFSGGSVTESFAQSASLNPKVDIVMLIDKSGSMFDDIAEVIANAQTFAATLKSNGSDFRFAISVRDNGCVAGDVPWIDNATAETDIPDIVDAMIALDESHGVNTERGFTLAEAALSPGNLAEGGCNAGLLRDDARLDLVFISDEPEQSVEAWTYYVSAFTQLKSDRREVKFHAIAGDYPFGCSSASAGTGYYEGTVQTGGYFLSICTTNWASELELLANANAISLNTSFSLSSYAVPDSVRVWIDGLEINEGWRHLPYYRVKDNPRFINIFDVIAFDPGSIPALGQSVVVEYELVPDCPVAQ